MWRIPFLSYNIWFLGFIKVYSYIFIFKGLSSNLLLVVLWHVNDSFCYDQTWSICFYVKVASDNVSHLTILFIYFYL